MRADSWRLTAMTDRISILTGISVVTRHFRTAQRGFKNMNNFRRATAFSMPQWVVKISFSLLSLTLLLAMGSLNVSAYQDAPAPPQAPPGGPAPPYTQGTPEQLQQLVAPIALYQDSLVEQILAASTFPEQVVEAER